MDLLEKAKLWQSRCVDIHSNLDSTGMLKVHGGEFRRFLDAVIAYIEDTSCEVTIGPSLGDQSRTRTLAIMAMIRWTDSPPRPLDDAIKDAEFVLEEIESWQK